jgi:undecaprenyl diphosphate synthase
MKFKLLLLSNLRLQDSSVLSSQSKLTGLRVLAEPSVQYYLCVRKAPFSGGSQQSSDIINIMTLTNTRAMKVPNHLGLILDGNRRWAKENQLSVAQGHRRGYQNLKTVARAAIKYGVRYVSAYVFSTENWQRDRQEVNDIMKILRWVLIHEVNTFHKDNIRLRVLGSKVKLGAALLTAIHDAEKLTENNTRGTILLYLDYGGQQEVVDSIKTIVASGTKPEDVTTELVSKNLYAPDAPPADLIIRTSGEQRLSNFMTWRSVYSELMFTKKYWPDFNEQDLIKAFKTYAILERRFGK